MTMLKIDKLVSQFNDAISSKDWVGCCENCFRVLYGLPETSQRELAELMVQRYMPIFHSRWPDISWPKIILEQPSAWFSKNGRDIPEKPDILNPADAAFCFCFDAILNAIAHPSEPVIITSSYMSAINSAIDARSTNVWMADDPEAVILWEKQGYFPGRSAEENMAAIAITEREWRVVGDWLSEKKWIELFNSSSEGDAKQGLEKWKENEMSLIISSIT